MTKPKDKPPLSTEAPELTEARATDETPGPVVDAAARAEQERAITKTATARASGGSKRAQTPSVGRIVHFLDREMVLHAATLTRQRRERGIDAPVEPEPFAATITRVHRVNGEPTGTVGLEVHHPELGPQIARDVPFADEYTAGHWSWPPYVP